MKLQNILIHVVCAIVPDLYIQGQDILINVCTLVPDLYIHGLDILIHVCTLVPDLNIQLLDVLIHICSLVPDCVSQNTPGSRSHKGISNMIMTLSLVLHFYYDIPGSAEYK